MNIAIVAVDKMREAYLRRGCEAYIARLAPYWKITTIEVDPAKRGDAVAAEGKAILSRVRERDALWALDRMGKSVTSLELAKSIAGASASGVGRLVLAIGGPDGLHASVLERADFVWSLSRLTFLHEMARLIALEQLFRAAKINRGEPYHR